MKELLNFMGEHPFLTWFLAWGIWVIPVTLNIPFRAWNRWLRSKNIKAHGWPKNPLMDADGDIVHPEKDDAKRK